MLKLSLKTLAAILIPVMLAFAMTSHASRPADEETDLEILTTCDQQANVIKTDADGEKTIVRSCKDEAKSCVVRILKIGRGSIAAAQCE